MADRHGDGGRLVRPRRVAVLGAGGTIASTVNGDGGATPSRTAEELVGYSRPHSVEVSTVEEVHQVLSPALTPGDMWALVSRADALVRTGVAEGVVVTHGTATMSESAYLADLTWVHEAPIVFTGAMIHAGREDSDGPRNLRDALLVASTEETRDLGALLVANGEMHDARHVLKGHKSDVATFSSGKYGVLGFVDDGAVFVHRNRRDRQSFRIGAPVEDVVLIKAYTGMDDTFLRIAHQKDVAGVVLECFPGRGGLPPSLLPAVEALASCGKPVVLSGAAEGRLSETYAGPAGTRTFAQSGAILGGDLHPTKARVLLMVALAWANGDLQGVREVFKRVVG